MVYSKTKITNIGLSNEIKEIYVRRSVLGGLISWWIKKCEKFVGSDLIVETSELFRKVIINGEEYQKVAPNLNH